MNDNDSPQWPNMDWLNSIQQPDSAGAPTTPCIRVSNDRYASHASFEDRLTRDDKLLLKSMGIVL